MKQARGAFLALATSIAAFLLLATSHRPAYPQILAAAPGIQLGDTWVYVRRNKTRFVQVVVEAAGSTYTVASGRRFEPFDSTMEIFSIVDGKLTGRQRMVFPLDIGREWRVNYPWAGKHLVGSDKLTRKVVALEKVTVPAGEFDAYRIESSGRFEVDNDPTAKMILTSSGPRTETYWYAPAAKRIVKFESRNRVYNPWDLIDFEEGYELLRMHLVPAAPDSPLQDGKWSVTGTSTEGRPLSYLVAVRNGRAVWNSQGVAGADQCELASAPVEFEVEAGGTRARTRVKRSVPAVRCPDLVFALVRENEEKWSGEAGGSGQVVLTRH